MQITDMRDKSSLKIEQAKIELIKQQMDSKLMTLEAIEAAKDCYKRRYISEMRMTSHSKNNQGGDVLQQIVGNFYDAKKATGN